jgi:hypothetical protein
MDATPVMSAVLCASLSSCVGSLGALGCSANTYAQTIIKQLPLCMHACNAQGRDVTNTADHDPSRYTLTNFGALLAQLIRRKWAIRARKLWTLKMHSFRIKLLRCQPMNHSTPQMAYPEKNIVHLSYMCYRCNKPSMYLQLN